ncbi:AMP-binding protein, partial [Nonomuraea salmonea]|uniref:AMP-binding protein n=1 Tax=Nonomuraea salmonea TaxID=46181 RepID=UPI00361438BA
DTAATVPDVTVVDLFEAQVARTPDAVAVVCGGVEVSYAELHARSDRLANVLVERGVGPESIVGVALERGIELIVAVFGVLKAGGAYLPIDVGYPAERIAYLIEDARPVTVLVSAEDGGRAACPGADPWTICGLAPRVPVRRVGLRPEHPGLRDLHVGLHRASRRGCWSSTGRWPICCTGPRARSASCRGCWRRRR